MSPGQKKTLAKSLGDVLRNGQSSSASMRDFHHTSLPEAISGASHPGPQEKMTCGVGIERADSGTLWGNLRWSVVSLSRKSSCLLMLTASYSAPE